MIIVDIYSSGEYGGESEDSESDKGEGSEEKGGEPLSSSDGDEDSDDGSVEEHDSSSSSSEDELEREEGKKGFMDGGKVETFSRAFNRLVEQAQDSRVHAPILSGSKSIHKMKEEEKKDLEASKAVKQFKDEMKRRGHYVPKRKGVDPEKDAREKRLQKTATKGVVQLFNAINAAQKRIRNEETKGNKGKIARLGKAGFLAEIRHMKEKEKEKEAQQPSTKNDEATKNNAGGWDVLKEGFVGINHTSVKMKDWDKEQVSSDDDKAEDISSDSEGF